MAGYSVPENREKALQEYCHQIQYHRLQRRIATQLQRLRETEDGHDPEGASHWAKLEYELERERYRLGENG